MLEHFFLFYYFRATALYLLRRCIVRKLVAYSVQEERFWSTLFKLDSGPRVKMREKCKQNTQRVDKLVVIFLTADSEHSFRFI